MRMWRADRSKSLTLHATDTTPWRERTHRDEKPSLHSPPFPSGRKCVILAIRNSGSQRSGAPAMDYDELVAKVIELLQREKRIPYRSLKRRFDVDDDYIEDLKIDLIEAKRLAIDENDRILVWVGDAQAVTSQVAQATQSPAALAQHSPQVASLP